MPTPSAFNVYIKEGSEEIEVVTPAKSESLKPPLGFEKRDRIPRTPVKDDAEVNNADDDIFGPVSASQIHSPTGTDDLFDNVQQPPPIQKIDRKKKPWWCWRRLCIIS
jgi:hypothetical protein